VGHFRIPSFVNLGKYVSEQALDSLYRVMWAATDPKSPAYQAIQQQLPDGQPGERAERTAALKEFALLVHKALDVHRRG